MIEGEYIFKDLKNGADLIGSNLNEMLNKINTFVIKPKLWLVNYYYIIIINK